MHGNIIKMAKMQTILSVTTELMYANLYIRLTLNEHEIHPIVFPKLLFEEGPVFTVKIVNSEYMKRIQYEYENNHICELL